MSTLRFRLLFVMALGALVSLASLLPACGRSTTDGNDENAPPGTLVRSSKPRLTSQAIPAADTQQLTRDNAAFAFDALKAAPAVTKNESFFFSPHSISLALAMTSVGARERTAAQLAQVMHFSLKPEDRLHAAFGALDLELAGRSRPTGLSSGDAFQLNVVNALWGQQGYTFLTPFLDVLAERYGAGLSLLDFAANPEGSRGAINEWVSKQTATRIPELLPQGSVTSATVLVLTNAIYFKASWYEPFDPANTVDGAFKKLDGSTSPARFMHQSKERRYADGEGWQALEIPYVGQNDNAGDVSMVFVLPAAGTFEAFRAGFDATRLASITSSLATSSRYVDITLPRFQFRSQLAVKPVLQSLGMTDAFQGGVADFSGMDGSRSLFIQDVLHEAFVAVDEKGTEAAAATAVIVGRTSAPERATFTADRPFFIVIRDNPTGAVLFVGQVMST